MNVAAQAIELGHDNWGFHFLCRLQRRGELRSPVERIGALSGFNLLERLNEVEPFSLGKPRQGGPLCFKAKTVERPFPAPCFRRRDARAPGSATRF
jgi:hypothetical protein